MKRNPFLHWLLVFLTLGQYAFLWAFKLAADINKLNPATPIALKMQARISLFGYISYFALLIGLSYGTPNEPNATEDLIFELAYRIAIGLLVLFYSLLVQIARRLREFTDSPSPRASIVIILTFLWFSSLPLLQRYVNRLVSRRQES